MSVPLSSVIPDSVMSVQLSGMPPDGVWPGVISAFSKYTSNFTGFAGSNVPSLESKTRSSSRFENKQS